MASPNLYQNGIGGTSGDILTTSDPLWCLNGANVWYVHHTGTDAAAPAGLQREKPLATTAQANTNCAAGDIIVYLSGHVETLSGAVTVNKARLVFVSEGTGTSRARFISAFAGQAFGLNGAGCQLRNLYFPASTVAPVISRIGVTGAGALVKDCYFECGASDTVPTVLVAVGGDHTSVDGTTFVATASQPSVGIEVFGAVSHMSLNGCTFDGGSYGFSDYAFKGTAAITGLRGEGNNMLNNADVILATGSSGYWYPGVTSGSARFVQTA